MTCSCAPISAPPSTRSTTTSATATGHPLIVIPTAGGKSLVMAAFIQEVLAQWPDERIIILTHVRELISQNFAELIRLWPEAPAGSTAPG